MPSPSDPSLGPSKSNGYRVTSANELSDVLWNAVLGDVSLRLAGVETKAQGYDALVAAGIGVALARIDEGLAPAAQQVQDIITRTQAYLTQLQGSAISASLIAPTPDRLFLSAAQAAAIADLLTRVGALETRTTSSRSFYLATG